MKADTKEIGPQKVVRVSIYRTWQVNSILSTTWELSFGASKNCQNSSFPTIQNVMDELSKSSYIWDLKKDTEGKGHMVGSEMAILPILYVIKMSLHREVAQWLGGGK